VVADEKNPTASTTRTKNITFNSAAFTYSENGVTTCFDITTSSTCQ